MRFAASSGPTCGPWWPGHCGTATLATLGRTVASGDERTRQFFPLMLDWGAIAGSCYQSAERTRSHRRRGTRPMNFAMAPARLRAMAHLEHSIQRRSASSAAAHVQPTGDGAASAWRVARTSNIAAQRAASASPERCFLAKRRAPAAAPCAFRSPHQHLRPFQAAFRPSPRRSGRHRRGPRSTTRRHRASR